MPPSERSWIKRRFLVLTRRLGFALGCLLVWIASPATADVIYQYTGNPFTTVTPPYTTSDFVSVSLTLAEPLPPNFDGSPAIVNLTMNDGVQTLSSSSNTGDCPQTICLELLTDGAGGIIGWSVFLGTTFTGGHSAISTAAGLPVILFTDEGGNLEGSGVNSDSPGKWVEIVPEPSTGLLGISSAERKRRAAG